MKNSILFLLPVALLLFARCSKDTPLNDEQYIKQVYIVGADMTSNMGMKTAEVDFSEGEQSVVQISVGTSGTLNIDRDISVTLAQAGVEAVADYNFKYMSGQEVLYQMLEAAYYDIPLNKVTIPKGQLYGTMPVYVNPVALHCDSLYALTFQIESISDPDYMAIRETDTVLIVALSFVNAYSGVYNSEGLFFPWSNGAAVGDSASISTSRTLKAVDANTVRFYHLAQSESQNNIEPYGVTIRVADDNTLEISAWGSLVITDGGGSYNAALKTFDIWYNYFSGTTQYRFSGKMKRAD